MSSVAEQLRAAREAQGYTIYDVAEVTKIRTDHLRALEEGNYDVFVAPVYIRGFVRNYARYLRMDLAAVMEQLEVELGQTDKFREPPALTNEPQGIVDVLMLQLSQVNWSVILPLLLVVAALTLSAWGYQAWRRHKTSDPLSDLGPGLYRPRPEMKDLYLPVPTNMPPGRTQ